MHGEPARVRAPLGACHIWPSPSSRHANPRACCHAHAQVANGYLLKQDVEELMGRISVSDTLAETLVKSEARARPVGCG